MKVIEVPEVQPEARAEALIKEAREHQRRRHLVLVIIAIVVIAGASTAVALITNPPAAKSVASPLSKPTAAGPPMGRIVSLKLASRTPCEQSEWCPLCRRRATS